jgi:hypothetical protein
MWVGYCGINIDLYQQQKELSWSMMSKISKQPIEMRILSTSYAAKMFFFVLWQTNVALGHLIGFGATSIYPPVLKRGNGQSPICR